MRPTAIHDPGKVLVDLAIAVAIGGDCLADISQDRSEPGLFGKVASDPTVTLAVDAPAALAAIDGARAEVRARVWALAGAAAPDHQVSVKNPLVMDMDSSLASSHSEKCSLQRLSSGSFGSHPIGAWGRPR
jgi:hypothetical protein